MDLPRKKLSSRTSEAQIRDRRKRGAQASVPDLRATRSSGMTAGFRSHAIAFLQRGKILAAALLLLSTPALADTIVSPAPDKVAVTLYRADAAPWQSLYPWQRQQAARDGLILVSETRTVDLPAGRHTLRFAGVADAVIPQSATLEGLAGGVVERNYDYAVLSPGTLLERSLNQSIGIVRTNPKTGRKTQESAIVRQGPYGVVLQTAGGVEALGCSGGVEALVFDRVPDGLSDKPALSTVVDVPVATRAHLTLSYLATGVTWQADYVARIHPDGKTLDLGGWLTLINTSGTGFVDAPTQAVAGKLSRRPVDTPQGQVKAIQRQCWPMDTTTDGLDEGQDVGGFMSPMAMMAPPPPPPPPPAPEMRAVTANRAKLAEQSELGDYKLYTLPEPVTVAARQTKQVAFLDQKDVSFQRLYVFTIDPSDAYADPRVAAAPFVVLRLENKPGEGLGKPLPAGALAVMETANGRPAFAGEQRMRDVAVGQPFDLAIGEAMDVQIRPRLVADQDRGKDRVRRTYEVDLANAKTAPITVELRLPSDLDGFKLVSEPGQHDVRDGAMAWRFTLPANARKTVRYVVEYDD